MIPIVSPWKISKHPMSSSLFATDVSFEGEISPSTGHPIAKDTYLPRNTLKLMQSRLLAS